LLVASSFSVSHVAEAGASEDGARLHHHAVAEGCPRIDSDIGINAAVASDHYAVAGIVGNIANHGTGADCSFVADLDAIADNRARSDRYIRAGFGGGSGDGGGIDSAVFIRRAE